MYRAQYISKRQLNIDNKPLQQLCCRFLTIALLIGLCCPDMLNSQSREAENWYFGDEFVLNFGNGALNRAGTSSMQTLEGGAAYSDPQSGALLFYTDGMQVWDRQNNLMPGSAVNVVTSTIKPSYSTSQSALIVPQPGRSGIYYIFNPGNVSSFLSENLSQFHTLAYSSMSYQVVSLSARGGLGDVIEQRVLRPDISLAEKVTGTYNACADEFVIVSSALGATSRLYLWRLGVDGIVSEDPEVSSFGNRGVTHRQGQLKFSPDGQRIVEAEYNDARSSLMIFEFDPATREISEPLSPDISVSRSNNAQGFYSASFAANNSSLYAYGTESGLIQFDLSTFNLDAINRSRFDHDEPISGDAIGALQLAPDGAMYLLITAQLRPRLSRIVNPNSFGADVNIERRILSFGSFFNPRTSFGLPNFMDYIFGDGTAAGFAFETTISAREICAGETVRLSATGAATYLWEPAELFNDNTLAEQNISLLESTLVRLTAERNSCAVTREFDIKVLEPAVLRVNADTTICAGDELEVWVEGAENVNWEPAELFDDPTALRQRISPLDDTQIQVRTAGDACPAQAEFKVDVTQLGNIDLQFSLPASLANENGSAIVPLIVAVSGAELPLEIAAFRLTVEYSRDLLGLVELAGGEIIQSSNVNGRRLTEIEIEGLTVTESPQQVTELEFLAFMAPQAQSQIELREFNQADDARGCLPTARYKSGTYSNAAYCLNYGIVFRTLLALQLAPNPADEFITVRLQPSSSQQTTHLTATNSFGKKFLDEQLVANGTDVIERRHDTSLWPAGAYILRAQSGKQTRTVNFTVVH